MVVRLDFANGQAKPIATGFCAAVIRSKARLDYPGVAAALDGDFRGRRERYRQWASVLAKLTDFELPQAERSLTNGIVVPIVVALVAVALTTWRLNKANVA